MEKWAFLNEGFLPEQDAKLGISDLSIQRGYGVFDFFKCINGLPVFLDDHLDRLFFSIKSLRLEPIFPREEITKIIRELINKNNISNSGIRITVTGGYSKDGYLPGKPNLIITENNFTSPTHQAFSEGIKLITHHYQRQLPHVKTIDYLMAIWLQQEIKNRAAHEVLYYSNQTITECPRANIFIVTGDDELITPNENILQGITRKHVLALAKNFYKVDERSISITELTHSKEVFITSTTKSILPVCSIDETRYPSHGKITTHLSQLLCAEIKKYLEENK